ncbi:hypothetical protein GM3708_153 [Geminocystis sp. NIES-3708]|uniref:hypothetical protein n=1 Tax=Geminocystis sp. NIES-3708 TaxID=1615909 RepID=UPI0005FC779F|nr:hypothetical protein [Geminocystis sp. NIES-3708]BAQ59748.1 hypothetical protein GM3708_153 [Geminocystis sp. NIES-3708]
MARIDLIGFILSTATISLVLSVGKVAQACADLPNICEQQRLHWQEMNDIGAVQEAINRSQQEEESFSTPSSQPYDPMQERLNVAFSLIQLVISNAQKVDQLTNDPRFQRYHNGGWDFFQGKNDAAPGEYCAAFFWKKDGFIRISGPGGDYQGALLTFWGENIPRPDKLQTIRATLSQSTGAPQTVKVFNYIQPGEPYGAISFTVPSIEMALEAMNDVESFDISIEGKSVAKVEWNDGLMARDKLRECVSAKRTK